MEIQIVWGTADGKTSISAFDRALGIAGIHNYNLVMLSSIIPLNSKIIEVGTIKSQENVGDILRVVLSSITSKEKGEWISTGLGWAQADEGGVFFEHSTNQYANICESEIKEGVKDMMKSRNWNWNTKIKTRIIEHKVKDIGSAVVAAVYGTQKL